MNKFIYTIFLSIICFASCEENIIVDNPVPKSDEQEVSYTSTILNIKVTEDFASKIESKTVTTKSQIFSSIDIASLERIFPPAGKFEKRTREEGLHLWYRLAFSEKQTLTKVKSDILKIDGIEVVENIPSRRLAYTPFFNDPSYTNQWHYFNDGSVNRSKVGCDMNVVPVWEEFTTGSDEVIVSVVDQGVDYNHEDLKDNMWVNEAEMNGQKGVDDDGNGYIDDIYGSNFMYGKRDIVPGEHGTHVAGTIAAVNNNGIGVSGVAGGDAKKGIKGVRIMSCQVGEDITLTGDIAAAIKYGADNGAVISQNSWGSEAVNINEADKAAIDYFIKYAGIDENGNQTGPMKGGIVIFAAGNEDRPARSPGNYPPVVCVSSVRADFEKSYFSCYGDNVDVAAPGGDVQYRNHPIISTVPNNQYDGYQGTSMACPHVSGLAALLISHFGKEPGLTPSEIEHRIVNFVTPIDEYNDPEYYLGTGLINAYKAFVGEGVAPERITDLELTAVSNTIKFDFTVPSDEDDTHLSKVAVYYSKEEFTDINNAMDVDIFDISEYNTGEKFSGQIEGLEFTTKYYVAAIVYDKSSNRSKLSNIESTTTNINNSPSIVADENMEDIVIRAHESRVFYFTINDIDGHRLAVSVLPNSKGVTVEREGDNRVKLIINGKKHSSGDYAIELKVSDDFGASSVLPIEYTILRNNPPEIIKYVDNILFNSKSASSISFNINEYVTDPDGETLSVNVFKSNENVVSVEVSDEGQVIITPLKYGSVNISLSAEDSFRRQVDLNFKVLVRDGDQEYDVFPNPVVDVLNVRTGEDVSAEVSLVGDLGNVLYKQTVTISPFSPVQIDMKGFRAGIYTLIVKNSDTETRKNIVKL